MFYLQTDDDEPKEEGETTSTPETPAEPELDEGKE